jgi:hypothetical protein
MDKIVEFLRRQYEVQGYHVSSITGPHGEKQRFSVHFSGRGPWGRKHRQVAMATVQSLIEMSTRRDLLEVAHG